MVVAVQVGRLTWSVRLAVLVVEVQEPQVFRGQVVAVLVLQGKVLQVVTVITSMGLTLLAVVVAVLARLEQMLPPVRLLAGLVVPVFLPQLRVPLLLGQVVAVAVGQRLALVVRAVGALVVRLAQLREQQVA